MKITNNIKYFPIIFQFSFLCLIKNITDNTSKKIKPSALIMVASETNANEKYTSFLLE